MNTWLEKSTEERLNIASMLQAKHGCEYICVIVQIGFDIKKILISKENTVSNLMCKIRLNYAINSSEAIYIFILKENKDERMEIPKITCSVGEIYDKYKWEDEILYIKAMKETTFGTPDCTYRFLGCFWDTADFIQRIKIKLSYWWNKDYYRECRIHEEIHSNERTKLVR